MKRLCVLVTGNAPEAMVRDFGDCDEWFCEGLGVAPKDALIPQVYKGDPFPDAGDLLGVVVTGSMAFVTDKEPWSEASAEWLVELSKTPVPILGVCYGHQLLAHGLGGRVDMNPRGREMGTVDVQLNERAKGDELFGSLPNPLVVQATHQQSVVELPEGAVVMGGNDLDPHHVVRFAPRAWGVQFHPEAEEQVMRRYLEVRAPALAEEGFDPDAMIASVKATPHGPTLLRAFADLCRKLHG